MDFIMLIFVVDFLRFLSGFCVVFIEILFEGGGKRVVNSFAKQNIFRKRVNVIDWLVE